mmetsp:Transcript_36596/g.113896  ORF Transcript_36596/g.113896 Transcript_36596/m.113896 type:complete len:298 (+) Transcript_36596:1020-1913(+)
MQVRLPGQGEVPQVGAPQGQPQERGLLARCGPARGGPPRALRHARCLVGCLDDPAMLCHVGAQDEVDDESAEVGPVPGGQVLQKVAPGAGEHAECLGDGVLLVHVHVVVPDGLHVTCPHEKIIRQALVIVVMDDGSHQTGQLCQRSPAEHRPPVLLVRAADDWGDRLHETAVLQQGIHGLKHGGSVQLVVVGIGVVVPSLDLLEEQRELLVVHAELVGEPAPLEYVHPERAQRPVVRGLGQGKRIKVPAGPRVLEQHGSGRSGQGPLLRLMEMFLDGRPQCVVRIEILLLEQKTSHR